jgi:hypothetical protein
MNQEGLAAGVQAAEVGNFEGKLLRPGLWNRLRYASFPFCEYKNETDQSRNKSTGYGY